AVGGRGGGEHDRLHPGLAHRFQHAEGPGHILVVGVQRTVDALPGILEPRHVHHAHALVFLHGPGQGSGVEDRGAHERHTFGDELLVPTGEIVHHHHVDPCRHEGAHHVRTDVPGSTGDHPGHACAPSSKLNVGISSASPWCTCEAIRLIVAQRSASRPASVSASKVTWDSAKGWNSRRWIWRWRSSATAVNCAGWALRTPFSSARGTSGTFTFSTRWSCGWLVTHCRACASTWAAVSQCSGSRAVIEAAMAAMPWAAATTAAPTVPECMMAGPTFGPRLMPDRSTSGAGPRSPAPAA